MLHYIEQQTNMSRSKKLIYDIVFTLLFMILTTAIAFLLFNLTRAITANITALFILALIIVTRFTDGYIYGSVFSIYSVICVNYLFTYPFFQLNFTIAGYPVTFLLMAAIALTTSTTSSHLKIQSKQLAQQKEQLKKAEMEAMRANLLRAISHDIRTPLTCIIGETETYFESDNNDDKDKMIHRIDDDAHWLLNMVENLLSVTRIQQDGVAKVHETPELVEEIVSEALQRFRKRQPDVVVDVTIPTDYIMLPMDPLLIEQVIINLLDNASVHSESDTAIELRVVDEGSQVSFHIRDYGIGIDPKMLARIFDGVGLSESFSADSHRGIGIGLSICKTIIEAHKGTVNAMNHTSGAEFIFTLPKEA